MLDTHACFISFIALPDRPLQSTLEPRSRRSPMPTIATWRSPLPSTTWSSPSTRSSLKVPRQEASPFRSLLICARLIKATLYSHVCTQILLLPLTLCSRAVVFEPSSCVFFIYRVVLWLPYRESLISVVYPACMITVHGLILRVSQYIIFSS